MRKIAGAVAIGVGLAAGYALERIAIRYLHGWPEDVSKRQSGTSVPTDHAAGIVDGAGGAQIHWRSNGHGSPVFVFAHGVGLDHSIWREQTSCLAERGHRVVVYDAAGHGSSTLGTNHSEMSSGFGTDVAAVIEQLDLIDVVLVGHSMGGMAVQQAIIDRPDLVRRRVRGVVLLSTAPMGRFLSAPFGGSRFGSRLAGLEAKTATPVAKWLAGQLPLSVIFGSRDAAVMATRIAFGSGASEAKIASTRHLVESTPRQTFATAVSSILDFDVRSRIGEIDVPILVVGGTYDPITPLHLGFEISKPARNARLEIFERGGHMLMYEQTERLNELLVDFASRI